MTRFRSAAIAETATWLALLGGMIVKYSGGTEAGVGVFGLIHGIVVLVYVAVALVTARQLRWSPRTLLLSLFASVPPLGTIVFERWAHREGLLGTRHETTERAAA